MNTKEYKLAKGVKKLSNTHLTVERYKNGRSPRFELTQAQADLMGDHVELATKTTSTEEGDE